MKKLVFLLAICLLCTGFSGCRKQDKHSESLFFMNTVIGITLYTEDGELADRLFAECRTLLGELEALWARQRETSEIAGFNASEEGGEVLDPRTRHLLETAISISQKTNGAFDMTVAPLVELWETAGACNALPSKEALSQALAAVGYRQLILEEGTLYKTNPNVMIDLGGIGKGAATTLLIEHLSSSGVDGGLVSFGSNVAVFGKKPSGEEFRVAIQDPHDAAGRIGKLTLPEGSVLSVSGDYERYVTVDDVRYHHILDPKTGYPAKSGLSSVAVISFDGAEADALSTALFVMGKDAALTLYASGACRFEAIFVEENGTVTATEGLRDLFEAEKQ